MFNLAPMGAAQVGLAQVGERHVRLGADGRCPLSLNLARARYFSQTTGLLRVPMPSISMLITSPSFMFSGAPSVPIQITSPG